MSNPTGTFVCVHCRQTLAVDQRHQYTAEFCRPCVAEIMADPPDYVPPHPDADADPYWRG